LNQHGAAKSFSVKTVDTVRFNKDKETSAFSVWFSSQRWCSTTRSFQNPKQHWQNRWSLNRSNCYRRIS